MRRLALFIAVAGMASATAITFTNNDTGILYMYDSLVVQAPTGVTAAHGTLGAFGGLCTGASSTFVANPPICTNPTAPDTLTFTLSTAGTLQIHLQDEFQVADVYQVLLSGSGGPVTGSPFQSSTVLYHGTTAQTCQNTADTHGSIDNSCLNVTTGILPAGNYSITVYDIILSYINQTDPFDSSSTVLAADNLSPAHFSLDLTFNPVPEPATLSMLGLGVVALGLIRRLRA